MKKRYLILALFGLVAGCSEDSVSGGGSGFCGNGAIDRAEQCDDGNSNDLDGCSSSCLVEFGYQCPTAGEACIKVDVDPEKCGNAELDAGELCDDGNKNSGDGCSSECNIESGYVCPEVGKACVRDEAKTCGNGKLDAGEACDDGNAVSGDGCAADCSQIESGYVCPNVGKPCKLESCGNGEEDEGEECDPGEYPTEYDFFEGSCTEQCKWAHFCGDGFVDTAYDEQCDANGKDTSAEYNGCTLSCKFGSNYCGDGKITHQETCDDGNAVSGDGCSADCRLEPGYLCAKPGEPCIKVNQDEPDSKKCGNGVLDANETCDDGNAEPGDGCSAACQTESGWVCPLGKDCRKTVCGDGKIEGSETCEDGNTKSGDGCSAECKTEPGWACPDIGKPCYAQMCGDGIIAGDEECDDRNMDSGDGCSRYCRREEGYHCDTAGMPCVKDVCGDGVVTGDEVCDEGTHKTAGCKDCKSIAFGWKCDNPGQACTNDAKCGNGILEGAETCEENSQCCVQCNIQPHCLCDSDGKNCVQGKCGNGIVEAGEECDDGNMLAGDGCDPVCRRESIFFCKEDGSCKPICGDGITVWEAGEECDDGNLISGDGCSSECTVEDGFQCTKYSHDYPDSINLPATFRDFRGWGDSTCTRANGQKIDGCITPGEAKTYGGKFQGNQGHPDFERENVNDIGHGIVDKQLGSDGLPVFVPGRTAGTITKTSFDMWYRNVPGINYTEKGHLKLGAKDKKNGVYYLKDMEYYPLTNKGYGNYQSTGKNYHFTTHIQTYFKYTGNTARLDFTGDDDVFVFVNGKRAIDLGGCHSASSDHFQLSSEKHPVTGLAYDRNYDLYEGGIYPISFFQAERHTSASTFELTLAGFLNMGESACDAVCGDGLIRGNEECDIQGHVNDEEAKKAGCVNCKFVSVCGNGVVEGDEQCDGGAGCTQDCKYANNQCGDGVVQAPETCDDGDKNGTPESTCRKNCQRVGCGNGVIDPGEECDDGNTSDLDNCTSRCTKPVCGDGIVQGWLGEVCDDGVNDGSYGGCGLGCAYFAPRCGDAIVDTMNGEECDDGVNSGAYGTCGPDCKKVARCGDGIVQPEYETCDDGDKNGTPGACSIYCRPVIN